ncbi:MAG: hypothetical protein K2X87_34285 [Gemmataceae bacterium]|nr:hypothetical protein [Gemmataceae bacterium]
MVLAVAGLNSAGVDARVRRLAGGDWSSFRPDGRTAFRFAHKQAKNPAAVEARDVRALAGRCGPERALDVDWWSCRCHYMTCVADAFQLPLEGTNVFDGFAPAAKP